MHVVMVTSSFPRYDGDFFGPWVLEYCKELVRQGHQVTIVAPQSNESRGPTIDMDGLSLEYFSYFFKKGQGLVSPPGLLPNLSRNPLLFFTIPFLLRGYYKTVKRIIKTRKVDVLHSQWAIPAGYINTLLARKYNIRHVVSTLGAELYLPVKHPFSRFSNFVFKNTDALFAVSEQMKERALAFDIDPDKIHVLPNTVDPDRFKNVQPGFLRSKIGVDSEISIILTVRRLVPEKRVIDLLQAFRKLDREDTVLVIGGDGPLREELEAYTAEKDLTERVHFLGFIDSAELPKYYADATVYVLSSQQEGLSISLLESLASGVVTVSTAGTGSDDAIIDGKSGFLYTVGDVDGLTNILRTILKDSPDGRAQIGKNAQKTIADKFSNKKIIERWIEIYKGTDS